MMDMAELEKESETDGIVNVESLRIGYETDSGVLEAVRDVSFSIRQGETLGIAGESGSGKSTLGYALVGYLSQNGRVLDGAIDFDGKRIDRLSEKNLRKIRGHKIAHVPQDPQTSLNPSMTVGSQIRETIFQHKGISKAESASRMLELLRDVEISDPRKTSKKYPHELSGGMQQRVLLAIALSCEPKLLILDEPTTGLDVTTQAKIIDLIQDLRTELDTSILLITHDLGVIRHIADRIAIMYAGEFLERGRTDEIFQKPANPYTRGLLNSIPDFGEESVTPIDGEIPDLTKSHQGCIFADRCEFVEDGCRANSIDEESITQTHASKCRRWEEVINEPLISDDEVTDFGYPERTDSDLILEGKQVEKWFTNSSGFLEIFGKSSRVKAVDGVDIEIRESETVGLVGESGCGKSTLGRTLLRLYNPSSGTVKYRGEHIQNLSPEERDLFRSDCQIVFQNPDSSLNPKKSIGQIIGRVLKVTLGMDRSDRRERTKELLNQVQLKESHIDKYPHQLSGGEKQRVAIARAFAPEPSLVILDEPVSALDVSVQAKILDLLDNLQAKYETSYLFISHDLNVVEFICDYIYVMYLGRIVESGTRASIFNPPYHPYTRVLLSNNLTISKDEISERTLLDGPVPSLENPPSGCPFHTRCPQKIGPECENKSPQLRPLSEGQSKHVVSCHLESREMSDPVDTPENTNQ